MCPKNYLVLGIETSCDETAVAIVNSQGDILTNLVYSQIKEHQDFGGVIPEFAARSHLLYLPSMIEKALKEAQVKKAALSAIAATAGPGLIGGLHVGVSFGKSMAQALSIPFIPINHLEGHALTVRLTDKVEYPFLLLLISGGHCQLIDVEAFKKYKILGSTVDDSIGELFDKTARLMDLEYPGGPKIEKIAQDGMPIIDLPKPFFGKPHCNFSFSGLKTAIQQLLKKDPYLSKADLASSLQSTVATILIDRLSQSLKITQRKTLVVSGGVAANKFIRQKLKDFSNQNDMAFLAPPINLCTDNAAMIAWTGIEHLIYNHMIKEMPTKPRWSLEELV